MNKIHEDGQFHAEINGKQTGLAGCPNHCERDCIRKHHRLPVLLKPEDVKKPCRLFIPAS